MMGFGKRDPVKRVFRTFFVSRAGLVLTRIADSIPCQRIAGLIPGIGG